MVYSRRVRPRFAEYDEQSSETDFVRVIRRETEGFIFINLLISTTIQGNKENVYTQTK